MKTKGILLVNLGSPDSTTIKDLKRYLGEFLMDKKVLDMPFWKRYLLVHGIILNTRPKKTAEAYKQIWRKEGSPLIIFSELFKARLETKTNIPIALGMRYGSMSIEKAIQELISQNVEEILLIPLYPQYAMSSFETVVEKTKELQEKYFQNITIETLPPFYKEENYIKVMSENLKNHLKGFNYDHILFSYHGIPERHIFITNSSHSQDQLINNKDCCENNPEAKKTCYRSQCFETTKLMTEYLGLDKDSFSISFQSRMLKDPWLKPYTDFELIDLPKKGIKNLAVITPAFVTDCLETLEEIEIRGQESFIESGGEYFKFIPCLNDNDDWTNTVAKWIDIWEKSS